MPTAARKKREADKRRQAEQDAKDLAEFDEKCARQTPAQREEMRTLFGESDDLIFELPSYLRMKRGLIQFDENGDVWFSKGIGRGGNQCRENDAVDTAKDLKRKYPDIWGKRGYAKKIAFETRLSVETIRRYFKKLP